VGAGALALARRVVAVRRGRRGLLAFDNALSVAAFLVLPGLGFLRRIRVEESLLGAELGEPYRAYARRTRRLIPGVW